MCGIAGWYRRGRDKVPIEAIVRQCDRLRHRGPDDAGYMVDGDFGFGMRRLSIIDISGGRQPMTSHDGRYSLIFNGEITNHHEIRKTLRGDYPFKTRSDTEAILAAFVHWGDDAWTRLEGMFAIAIWDSATRRLLLARDPLGIKPLFITAQNGGLAFASEITALEELPGHGFEVSADGLNDFFCFGHVLPPNSIFSEVHSLLPGHVLQIGPIGRPAVRPFWSASIKVAEGISEEEWIEETRTRVIDSVRKHMLSDVPIGAFVSGGIDSGGIAAAMAQCTSQPIKLFTAGFPGSRIDETAAAGRVAAHLGAEHVILPIEQGTAADILPKVQSAFDEPTAANSAVPLWYLSGAAAQHVKVVLCGEGGDELFLGYNRQRWAQRMSRFRPLARALGNAEFLDHLPALPNRKWNYLRDLAKRFRDGALLSNGYERFYASVSITSADLRSRILDEEFFRQQMPRSSPEARANRDFPLDRRLPLSEIEEFMLGDLTVHMPASLLQRLDRASMAHSLEARVPFLSHDFVDWALTIPPGLKLRHGTGKYVLRKAVEPWLPKGATDGRKLGFQMPLADWFMGDFNDFAREAWESSGASSIDGINRKGIEQVFSEHRSGAANHGRLLYALAMFGCWWDQRRARSAVTAPLPIQGELADERQML